MTVLGAFERLDLLVPLITGHLLADFVFQTDRMAVHKHRWGVLLGTLVSFAAAMVVGLVTKAALTAIR